MVKLLVSLVAAVLFVAGAGSPASAASSHANCLGTFASTNAGPSFGPFVASFAQQGGIGKETVGPSASTSGRSGRAVNPCAEFPTP